MTNENLETNCKWVIEVLDELRLYAMKSGLHNLERELGLLSHLADAELTAQTLLNKSLDETTSF